MSPMNVWSSHIYLCSFTFILLIKINENINQQLCGNHTISQLQLWVRHRYKIQEFSKSQFKGFVKINWLYGIYKQCGICFIVHFTYVVDFITCKLCAQFYFLSVKLLTYMCVVCMPEIDTHTHVGVRWLSWKAVVTCLSAHWHFFRQQQGRPQPVHTAQKAQTLAWRVWAWAQGGHLRPGHREARERAQNWTPLWTVRAGDPPPWGPGVKPPLWLACRWEVSPLAPPT